MIQNIKYNPRVSMIISNEPTTSLSAIFEIARNDDSHPLSSNYKNINTEDVLFHNIVMVDQEPVIFFSLQQTEWMGPTAARAFTRFYKVPDLRNKEYSLLLPLRDSILNYFEYSHWLDYYNIKTLFFTRNISKKKEVTRYWTTTHQWNLYPHTCTINGTDQRVFWCGEGNLEFLLTTHAGEA